MVAALIYRGLVGRMEGGSLSNDPLPRNSNNAKHCSGKGAAWSSCICIVCLSISWMCLEVCQSFALDNGAFSAWKEGKPITDWHPYYEWVDGIRHSPGFDFAVIPDVIDGDERANDCLMHRWPFRRISQFPSGTCIESIGRLKERRKTGRVSPSAVPQFATVGDAIWWGRMAKAMSAVCNAPGGRPICKAASACGC